MFGFGDRPTKVEARHEIAGERPAKVYPIGRYEVTVYEDGEVTYRSPSGYTGDPRRTLPNLEIEDGIVKIALEDLIDDILARVSSEELAVALWKDDAVKDRFIEALSNRYSYDNVGDEDRRKVLAAIKEEVHSAALDKLAGAMASLEYTHASKFVAHQTVRQANELLETYDVRRHDGSPVRLSDPTNAEPWNISGKVWNEAREHWRAEVLKQFPVPADPVEAA